ncbi:MAG: putative metal-dependent hydrolase [Gemmatimonadota bacterium]|nr:putative metal-dependent hydrolase [Gemmatimonadota bacterium]
MEDLRFPIGRFHFPDALNETERDTAIRSIENVPTALRDAVHGLSDEQLDTPYRPEGWTVRQVVHHLCDSHINSVVRFKLALTETQPTIRTYEEALWAELPDKDGAIDPSLALLEGLHLRWAYLLKRLSDDQWERTLNHPEVGELRVDQLAALYAWHGPHHVAHITSLKKRLQW